MEEVAGVQKRAVWLNSAVAHNPTVWWLVALLGGGPGVVAGSACATVYYATSPWSPGGPYAWTELVERCTIDV